MKTQKKKLVLGKNTIVELNTKTLSRVNGGSWTIVVDYISDKLETVTITQ
jgi:hypothetical protein